MQNTNYNISKALSDIVIKTIDDKKGLDIVRLDLREIAGSTTNYLVICHASSSTQVRAIADNIEKVVYETINENPWQREGLSFGEWIILDYVNVVVHIFQKDKRLFYNIEDLWGDAPREDFKQ